MRAGVECRTLRTAAPLVPAIAGTQLEALMPAYAGMADRSARSAAALVCGAAVACRSRRKAPVARTPRGPAQRSSRRNRAHGWCVPARASASAPIYPYRTFSTDYPVPYEYEYPGPSGVRQCKSRLVQEKRPSGPVVVPTMRCWWEQCADRSAQRIRRDTIAPLRFHFHSRTSTNCPAIAAAAAIAGETRWVRPL